MERNILQRNLHEYESFAIMAAGVTLCGSNPVLIVDEFLYRSLI